MKKKSNKKLKLLDLINLVFKIKNKNYLTILVYTQACIINWTNRRNIITRGGSIHIVSACIAN
jgi:hypothetical protein